MSAASYEIFRDIEKSNLSLRNYIKPSNQFIQQLINNINNAYKNGIINYNAFITINQLIENYMLMNPNKLYYFIINTSYNLYPSPQPQNISTPVYQNLIIDNFIKYIYQTITYIYTNNYINKSIYLYFTTTILPNITQIINTFNIPNYTRGNMYNYISNDYGKCVFELGHGSENICNYFIGGRNPLSLRLNNEIYMQQQNNPFNLEQNYYPITSTQTTYPLGLNNYLLGQNNYSLGQNNYSMFNEDAYNICSNNAFENNSSLLECNKYLGVLLNF